MSLENLRRQAWKGLIKSPIMSYDTLNANFSPLIPLLRLKLKQNNTSTFQSITSARFS